MTRLGAVTSVLKVLGDGLTVRRALRGHITSPVRRVPEEIGNLVGLSPTRPRP